MRNEALVATLILICRQFHCSDYGEPETIIPENWFFKWYSKSGPTKSENLNRTFVKFV